MSGVEIPHGAKAHEFGESVEGIECVENASARPLLRETPESDAFALARWETRAICKRYSGETLERLCRDGAHAGANRGKARPLSRAEFPDVSNIQYQGHTDIHGKRTCVDILQRAMLLFRKLECNFEKRQNACRGKSWRVCGCWADEGRTTYCRPSERASGCDAWRTPTWLM
jgi:hypothetical protein